MKWLCTLTPAQRTVRHGADVEVPNMAAVDFRDPGVAAEFVEGAAKLE